MCSEYLAYHVVNVGTKFNIEGYSSDFTIIVIHALALVTNMTVAGIGYCISHVPGLESGVQDAMS